MAKLKDLKPHARNANRGTERGSIQLEESIKRLGFGRGIVIDKNGVVIAGNHALGAAIEAGIEEAVIVKTNGRQVVVTQREDLDLENDQRALELAYADNRVSETNFNLDAATLASDIEAGLDLSPYYKKDEIDEIIEKGNDEDLGADQRDEAVVKIVFTKDQFDEYEKLSKRLGKKWSVAGAANIIVEAMRRAA